jgi:hypothetical protein
MSLYLNLALSRTVDSPVLFTTGSRDSPVNSPPCGRDSQVYSSPIVETPPVLNMLRSRPKLVYKNRL